MFLWCGVIIDKIESSCGVIRDKIESKLFSGISGIYSSRVQLDSTKWKNCKTHGQKKGREREEKGMGRGTVCISITSLDYYILVHQTVIQDKENLPINLTVWRN